MGEKHNSRQVAGMGIPKTSKDAKRRCKYVMQPKVHGKVGRRSMHVTAIRAASTAEGAHREEGL
eukprot:1369210-Amphidinium_carterae.1